ncbi:uncharacterized protein LOC144436628 isoform X2 [Glandiceps talaboti]
MSTRLSNTLDRPPSEQLADLHIYVIPGDSWNEKFRSAYNEVINESVSAGFVRVFPEITVYSLRDEIEEQLGYDVLPKDYVFLKSVGRCLTQVRGRQEVELKVKNFLPPLAYLPEIFVLPGQREHVPLALPSIEPRHRGDTDRYSHPDAHNSSPDPFSIEHYTHKSPLQEENKGEYLPPLSATPPPITEDMTQSESPSQRKTKVPGKDNNRSGRSDTYTNNTNEDSGIADDVEEELERKRREQEEEERRRREDQQRLIRLEQERRDQQRRDEEDRLRRLQEDERRRRDQEEADARERLADVERQTRDRLRQQEEDRIAREREQLDKQRKELDRLEDERRDRERREQDRHDQEEMERRQGELEEQMREEEERKRQEEERRKQALLQKQRKPFPSPPNRVSSKRDRADTDSAKERRQEEKDRLLDELQRARDDRQDMEKEREDLVKRAKALQTKTQQRRNKARDLWKKKYFEEKKKTPPLEQQVVTLKHKLDSEHKKYINQIEGKEARRKNMYQQPSEKTNMKVQIAKFQHDLEELRRRVENTKMKLTTEMKLRNQAETELRALRAELTQKKINVTLSRSQQLRALQESEGNLSFASPRSPLPHRPPGGLSPRIQ